MQKFTEDKYVMVSRFPPPIGGVSVFAQRKCDLIVGNGGHIRKIDLGRLKSIFLLLSVALKKRRVRVLVNTLNPIILFGVWIFGLLPYSTLYDHNSSRSYKTSELKIKYLIFICRRAKCVAVVHSRLAEWFAAYGIEAVVESPFIPPESWREKKVLESYPEQLKLFCGDKKGIVLLNSAWRYVVDAEGRDLYGVRDTLSLLRMLREQGYPCRMVFAFGDYNVSEMPLNLVKEIRQLTADGALYVLEGQREMWPLFSRVDLFLRTTSTDGESVSVLEALHFNCPVVASNAVPRPDGVLTYQYANLQSLCLTTICCIETYSHETS